MDEPPLPSREPELLPDHWDRDARYAEAQELTGPRSENLVSSLSQTDTAPEAAPGDEDDPLTVAWWIKWVDRYSFHGELPPEPVPPEFSEFIGSRISTAEETSEGATDPIWDWENDRPIWSSDSERS